MNIKENIKTLIIEKPLKLDCGQTISNFPLAYETFGTLNENKDNAILVCHALTGDQFVTGKFSGSISWLFMYIFYTIYRVTSNFLNKDLLIMSES